MTNYNSQDQNKLPYRFEIWKNEGKGHWWWRLYAGNNEIVCTSETYTSSESARHSAKQVQKYAGDATLGTGF